MEKHRNNPPHDNTREHTITIMGKARRIKLSKDKRKVNDLIAELREQYKSELVNFRFDHTVNVVLDGRVLKMNAQGEIEGNPTLLESSALSLMPQIVGGN